MKTPVGKGNSQSDFFPPTHWSVVMAAGESQVGREAALTELCQTYWAPLYSYVRGRGYTVHDAEDLTQSFLPLHEAQIKEAESLFQTHAEVSDRDRLFDRS